jgi:hypothetical protein
MMNLYCMLRELQAHREWYATLEQQVGLVCLIIFFYQLPIGMLVYLIM